jgi:hypothetical protein
LKKGSNKLDDDLRPEYDLKHLRLRKLGPERPSFNKEVVRLAPDVAEVFPDSDSVNEALRFLIRITGENKTTLSITGASDKRNKKRLFLSAVLTPPLGKNTTSSGRIGPENNAIVRMWQIRYGGSSNSRTLITHGWNLR